METVVEKRREDFSDGEKEVVEGAVIPVIYATPGKKSPLFVLIIVLTSCISHMWSTNQVCYSMFLIRMLNHVLIRNANHKSQLHVLIRSVNHMC